MRSLNHRRVAVSVLLCAILLSIPILPLGHYAQGANCDYPCDYFLQYCICCNYDCQINGIRYFNTIEGSCTIVGGVHGTCTGPVILPCNIYCV